MWNIIERNIIRQLIYEVAIEVSWHLAKKIKQRNNLTRFSCVSVFLIFFYKIIPTLSTCFIRFYNHYFVVFFW